MKARPATYDDWARLYTWVNDHETRQNSLSVDPIKLPDHLAWFERTLNDQERARLWIVVDALSACDPSAPIGVLRVERDLAHGRQVGVVSISLDSRWRGRGRAVPMIRMLPALVHEGWTDVTHLQAKVLDSNVASLRAFAEAGYRPVGHLERGRAVLLQREV